MEWNVQDVLHKLWVTFAGFFNMRSFPWGGHTHLQGALVGGGQGQRQVHERFKGAWLAVAGHALHRGLELALEQSHDDGLVQQLVFAPGKIGRCLIIQVVVFFFLVSFPVVGLNVVGEKNNSKTVTDVAHWNKRSSQSSWFEQQQRWNMKHCNCISNMNFLD